MMRRLGSNRINFKTYSIPQLEGILHARLDGLLENVIEKDAVTFAAKKVGTVSGDARRALDICRYVPSKHYFSSSFLILTRAH